MNSTQVGLGLALLAVSSLFLLGLSRFESQGSAFLMVVVAIFVAGAALVVGVVRERRGGHVRS